MLAFSDLLIILQLCPMAAIIIGVGMILLLFGLVTILFKQERKVITKEGDVETRMIWRSASFFRAVLIVLTFPFSLLYLFLKSVKKRNGRD